MSVIVVQFIQAINNKLFKTDIKTNEKMLYLDRGVYDMKRTDYINWDAYFMGIAMLSKERSKDPNTQVGACIVNDHNRIVSVGYNGLPNGCDDDKCPWDKREGAVEETKYAYVAHAELNAILNHHGSVEGCTVYVTLFPCNECAKAIIQSGIKKVIYLEDKYEGEPMNKVAKRLFDEAGILYTKYEKINKHIGFDL